MVLPKRQRALITGASSGIGRATAIAFAEAGFDLVLVSRSADRLHEVAALIQGQQPEAQVQVVPLDLAEVTQVRDRLTAVIAATGAIDVLVNNAGMGYTGSLAETALADWQRVIDLNLTSALQCIQAVLPSMRDRRSGLIINITSIAAHNAFPDWGAYSVSKAGLVSLSKILAAEERGHGIRVVMLCPGAVNTPIWDTDTVQADFDRSGMLTAETVAQSIVFTAMLPPQAVIEELTLTASTGAL